MKTLKFLDKHLEEFIMVLLLSSIVVIMLFQIIRRYIFNDSLSWSEEFCRYCFIWMMFVAFSYSARLGSDLRVDALISMLPQGCRNIIEIINLILCIMVAGFLFYHSFGNRGRCYGDRGSQCCAEAPHAVCLCRQRSRLRSWHGPLYPAAGTVYSGTEKIPC